MLIGLVLLNMFVAILHGYYWQVAPKDKENTIGFLGLLKNLVVTEFESIKEKQKLKREQQELKAQEELEDQQEKNGSDRPGAESGSEASPTKLWDRSPENTSIEKALEMMSRANISQDELKKKKGNKEKPKKPGKCKRIVQKIKGKFEDAWFWFITFIYEKIIQNFISFEPPVEFENKEVVSKNVGTTVKFQDKRAKDEEGIVLKDIEFYLGKKEEAPDNSSIPSSESEGMIDWNTAELLILIDH